MLMTFCDMQLAIGANYAGDLQRFLPTISLSADFLAPAPLGSWVQGRTEIARQARSMVFAHCIVTADGNPVVRANGIFQDLRRRRSELCDPGKAKRLTLLCSIALSV